MTSIDSYHKDLEDFFKLFLKLSLDLQVLNKSATSSQISSPLGPVVEHSPAQAGISPAQQQCAKSLWEEYIWLVDSLPCFWGQSHLLSASFSRSQ